MKKPNSNTPKPQPKTITFPLRVEPRVYEALKADAKKRHRSINGQINSLIERHLEEGAA